MNPGRSHLKVRALALAALALLSGLAVPGAEATHGALVTVNGDAGFSSTLWTGSGTASDPYRLTIAQIVPHGEFGLEIKDTRKHVNLSGMTISGGGSLYSGVRLTNATNVSIWGSTLESNKIGIHVLRSSDVLIGATTVKTSGTGVLLESSRGVTLRDNIVALNDRNVVFRLAPGNALRANNLSTATGQVGLFFEDNASYDNAIETTNVVNGIPVRWYTGIVSAVIPDVTVDLAGITNVAQIMVYNSSGLTLERAVAKSGIGNGIVVHASTGITIARPVAENNAKSGIHVELSNATRIDNASARNNAMSGVNVQSANDARLDWSSVTGNAREGVRIAAATNVAAIRNLTSSGNAQRGVVVEASRNVSIEDSALTGEAVSFQGSRDMSVRRTTLAGAAPSGITLSSSTAGRFEGNAIRDRATAVSFSASTRHNFTDNTIALGTTGFQFDSAASYDNELSPTNLVNGTPVRWYTNAVGPSTLENVTVELRGITNVAQIGVYRSGNLTFTNATARNGTAAGILVWDSHHVNFTGATAANNTADGLLADAGSGLKLLDSRVTGNGGDGVRMKSAHGPLVENTLFESNRGAGIHAEAGQSTTLRGNAIRMNTGLGISLDRVSPGAAAIEHNAITANGAGGILASASAVGVVQGNTLASNGQDGISLATVPAGARVESNTIAGQARGIRLRASSGTSLVSNAITIGQGQFGVFFDDEPSYNVNLSTSNLVNGAPVHWHVGNAGTTIASPRSELRGITNVAQIMLYKAENVTLSDALATNGSARGIYVFRSANVTVSEARVESNNESGLVVSTSNDTRIDGASAVRNLAAGARIESGARVSIENATFSRNNGGMDVVNASRILRIANDTFDSNGQRALMINASSAQLVRDNAFSGHDRSVQLDATNGTTFLNNTVALRPGTNDTAWWFVTPAAYGNHVGETNLVNGVPMRWYTGLSSATLTGIRAELRGLTNIAQIALIRPDNVELLDARAANGSAHGVYVENGLDVRILASNASANAGSGIELRGANFTAVRNTTLSGNGAGLTMSASTSNTIDNVTATRNVRDGISDQQGQAQRIQNVTATGNGAWGVSLTKSDDANVTRTAASANGAGGIRVAEGLAARIYDNLVSDTPTGISLGSAGAGARIGGNRVVNATNGIQLARTEFIELRGNAVTLGVNGTGFRFEDELSYNNVIPTTNTVDGAPVQWYTTLAGTETAPITLAGVRSELRGITNVAQVMLYRSSYVDLVDAVATNGSARGVYLYRSSSINVSGANATSNALAAVELNATQSSTVRNLSAQASGTGVRLVDALSNVASNVNATGAATGVRITAGSRDNRVDMVEVNGTARGIHDEGWSGAGLVGNNALGDAGPAKRVRVGGVLNLTDLVATYRHESQRIVEQRWSWGDGTADNVSTASALLRPSHAYGSLGRYRIDLRLTMADGVILTDLTWVDVVPPLSEPRDLTAIAGDGNATLRWTEPASDGALPITGYRVYRGENLTSLLPIATVAGLELTDRGLVNGRSYAYAVAAINAEGEGPRATTTIAPAGRPSAPLALAATPGSTIVNLSWRPPASLAGLPLSGYTVLRAAPNATLAPVATLGDLTSYVDTGLTNGVRYTYAVRASNALGDGPATGNVSATPVGPPSAPLGLRALGGDASATLQWSPPSQTGGVPVTGYRVWRAVGNETLAQLPGTLAANASTFRDTGLSNDVLYRYAVTAVNSVGEGAKSEPANATPQAVDALDPLVYAHEPARGAILGASPATIGALYVDNDGIVLDSVALYLDGALVGANVTNVSALYVVPAALAPGEHTARLVARDPTGNAANETWTFRILGEDELVARFEESGHALDTAIALPGANVTARLTVTNVGFANGTTVVRALYDNTSVGLEVIDLEPGASRELSFTFGATELGRHNVTVGSATLLLTVAQSVAENETAPVVEETPTNETVTPPTPAPKRPVRGTPPPREEQAGTPLPVAVGLCAVLIATVLFRRRR